MGVTIYVAHSLSHKKSWWKLIWTLESFYWEYNVKLSIHSTVRIYFGYSFLCICLCQEHKRKTMAMGLLSDAYNCGLRMRQECRERFPRHRLQRKPQVSDPGMHHGTCVTHVPWCMSRSLIRGGGENVSGIPGACATRNFAYLATGPINFVTMHTCVKLIHASMLSLV